MKLTFMSLFIEQYTCRYTSPTPSDHSGFGRRCGGRLLQLVTYKI